MGCRGGTDRRHFFPLGGKRLDLLYLETCAFAFRRRDGACLAFRGREASARESGRDHWAPWSKKKLLHGNLALNATRQSLQNVWEVWTRSGNPVILQPDNGALRMRHLVEQRGHGFTHFYSPAGIIN